MEREQGVYLGREGTVYGPYSSADVERLRLSGEILKFSFIWDSTRREWRHLDAVPPPPDGGARTEGPSPVEGLEAICHNEYALVAGRLENSNELGCEMVCPDPSESPGLVVGSVLLLDVLDGGRSRATILKVSLVGVDRRDGNWVYRLRWARPPSFR